MSVLSSTKAQLQMIEILMVVAVFVVILLVGLVFYFKFAAQSIHSAGENVCEVSNTVLLTALLSNPEMQCSSSGHEERCLDTMRLLFVKNLQTTATCRQKVSVVQVLPADNRTCTTVTYPDCGVYPLVNANLTFSSSYILSTPVGLYFPLTDTYTLGKLVIEVEA